VSVDLGEVWDAYDRASRGWAQGPEQVYDRMAGELVTRCPVALGGRRVLDLGAGTGAVSRAVASTGARPVALDAALGMARATSAAGVPSARGDASILPFAGESFAAVIAAFVVNHLPDPVAALAEVLRVLRPGGVLLASTFGVGPEHPVKAVVEEVARRHGWSPPDWYDRLKAEAGDPLADPDRFAALARRAGFRRASAATRTFATGADDARQMVEYRLGMPVLAGFASTLPAGERSVLLAEAVTALAPDPPPLRFPVVVLEAFS
jgi:ubiquinone/menaquinone biosynthesis C-methylase UbiE